MSYYLKILSILVFCNELFIIFNNLFVLSRLRLKCVSISLLHLKKTDISLVHF